MLMVKPWVYRVIGLLLLVLAGADAFYLREGWHFHLLYTGMILFIAGHALEHLHAIRSLTDVIIYDIRSGQPSRFVPLGEHAQEIRGLLDKINNREEARDKAANRSAGVRR